VPRLEAPKRRRKKTYVCLVAGDQTPLSSLAVRTVLARLVPRTRRLKNEVPSGTKECGLNPSVSHSSRLAALVVFRSLRVFVATQKNTQPAVFQCLENVDAIFAGVIAWASRFQSLEASSGIFPMLGKQKARRGSRLPRVGKTEEIKGIRLLWCGRSVPTPYRFYLP